MPTKTKEFLLTPETYWHPDRPHWSVSQINDYLKSPEYFFKKHVQKLIPKKVSAPMRVGSFVDALLTNPKEAPNYECKVLARDDKETYARQKDMSEMHLLTEQEWMKGTQLAEFIKSQPFWKDGLNEAIFQMPMETTMEVDVGARKMFLQLCGLPDRMDRDGDYLDIRDLKISSLIKTATPAKWFWNAKEMGYLRQFAMYRLLASRTFNIPKHKIRCSHIVGVWHDDSFCDVQLYYFPQSEVDAAEDELMQALEGIAAKQYGRKLLSWKDALNLEDHVRIAVPVVVEDDEEADEE